LLVNALAVTNNISSLSPPLKWRSKLYYALPVWTNVNYLRL